MLASPTTRRLTRGIRLVAATHNAGKVRELTELLAPFGLDATDPAFWTRGLDVIAGFIDELERTLAA